MRLSVVVKMIYWREPSTPAPSSSVLEWSEERMEWRGPGAAASEGLRHGDYGVAWSARDQPGWRGRWCSAEPGLHTDCTHPRVLRLPTVTRCGGRRRVGTRARASCTRRRMRCRLRARRSRGAYPLPCHGLDSLRPRSHRCPCADKAAGRRRRGAAGGTRIRTRVDLPRPGAPARCPVSVGETGLLAGGRLNSNRGSSVGRHLAAGPWLRLKLPLAEPDDVIALANGRSAVDHGEAA